ncbi:hypothetical protein [Qipengyuania spongiae]|uniref:UrcA family protein n=1 Tax=Qipengyuania spongiae TaxID=2909673 RepID=A0ABY5SZE0_9SPHN|nr:hypothetical protein [Qipengyuania spongiae]UVI39902.1 hypothetical protein L1F33_02775 [Qipengyuania spongiae]
MSILASILLMAQSVAAPAAAPPPPPLPTFVTAPTKEVADEIVVIGRKLEAWKGGLAAQDGQLTCRTNQSTGDEEIDGIRCGAMLRCFAPEVPEMNRLSSLDVPTEERNRLMQAHAETLVPCLDAAHEAGVRYLAEVRARAK